MFTRNWLRETSLRSFFALGQETIGKNIEKYFIVDTIFNAIKRLLNAIQFLFDRCDD